MDERLTRWGLSNGASVLALAGFFWYGLSFGVITTKWGWWVWGFSTVLQFGTTAGLLWAAMRLRRRSGFKGSDLKLGTQQQLQMRRRTAKAFLWVVILQALLVGGAVWWCVRTGVQDRVWPSIGLIVNLHFIALARVFRVQAYFVLGLVGSLISLIALRGLTDTRWILSYGGGMAALMWLTAWYIIHNAERFALAGLQENK